MAAPVVVVPPEPSPPSAADVEAARANASANAAAEAAAAATSLAEVQAARVNDDAANRIAGFEGKMAEWQNLATSNARTLQEVEQRYNETATLHGQAIDRLITEQQSILQRLAPPPEPNPTNPAQNPPVDAPPATEPAPPPVKRKAHRWI